MKKVTTKITGIAIAATMMLASGSVLAAPAYPPIPGGSSGQQVVQPTSDPATMADFDAEVAINSEGRTTNSTFYFTPMYDGEYSFSIVDPQFTAESMQASVKVGERPMSSEMTLQAGRTYTITCSVTSNSHRQRQWTQRGWQWVDVYDAGEGVYGLSIRFNAPEIEPEVSETVVVEVEDWRYDTQAREWTEVYTENSYQFTPETTGEYEVAIGDAESAWQWSDGWHQEGRSIVPNEPGEMTPTVFIYDGDDLIFALAGEGADVTKLDENVTYLVVATADHTGSYTLTITPVPAATEIHYTEEQLRAMSTSNFVGTLYSRILGRFSDAQGRAEFTDELLNQGYTATQIATIMFTSEEFGNLAMDDATFIATAYYTFCDREATADEAAALMAGLADGSTTRAQIIEQLAASDEWASFCAFYGVNV